MLFSNFALITKKKCFSYLINTLKYNQYKPYVLLLLYLVQSGNIDFLETPICQKV